MVTGEDDFPHPVPIQAFMPWKENWVFPALDAKQRIASLMHFSLRPAHGEGIFTAKFCIEGEDYRYVGRSPIPRDLTEMRPVANDKLSFTVVEPGKRFAIQFRGDDVEADIEYTARFPVYDFADGPKAPGDSVLGDVGRSVFPFNHYEQSLWHEGRIVVKNGKHAGQAFDVSGYSNRDHSWGWRQDLTFTQHHWICASFEDRFIEGSVMEEDFYPHGPKPGGWISTEEGNDPVRDVDTSNEYWLAPNEPLPVLDRDVRYRIETHGGQVATVTAHISKDYGRLYLDDRAPDRSKVYQDVQIFCDYTLEETGQRGHGVLEVGKRLEGEGVADNPAFRRSASPR